MSEPSLLIVEDNAQIRGEIKRVLSAAEPGVAFIEATTGLDALKATVQNPPDVVLCDVQMPEMDGFQFLRMFRSRAENAGVPVIMLTSRDDPDEKIFGLDAGATDYVTKPFIPGELVARVRVQLKLKALQDELRKANDQLRELSNTDHLTKVYNRRYFSEVLAAELRRCQRYNIVMSVAVVDIDHFKKINDTHGHAAGDAVLVDFAALLRSSLRTVDVVARWGGEEFVVLLPHTPAPSAHVALDKVRMQLGLLALGTLAPGAVSFSCGIASYPSETVDNVGVLVERADAALYKAKTSGRNRVMLDGQEPSPP